MKNLFFTSTKSLLVALLLTTAVTSCKKEETETVNPELRKAFIGNYQVKDQNEAETSHYSFKLFVSESDKGADKIKLQNFRYVNGAVTATVKGNQFQIDELMQAGNETLTIKGGGTLSGTALAYNYTLVYKKTGKADRVFINTAQATKN